MDAGRTLLHYRLAAKIGEGGMGEVWRATDTTLGREVAIKILPAPLAGDPERLARFEREAKVLASLNHPNVAAIHGFHEADGIRFLAMEMVPGEDLAARLGRGRVPVDEAIEVARQIAEALEAAHESGVVHRDLKPANVRLTPDGRVKVLDFGLAKALEPGPAFARGDASTSPTITSLGTVAGMILGTAAYMSPEQARGKPADRRADIWAFGVILYEMLAGSRLFGGETISDTLASVLKSDPRWDALPAATPRRVRALLERCLDRDPRQRLRDIGEARVILSGRDDVEAAPAPGAAAPRLPSALPWVLLTLVTALAAVAAFKAYAPTPEPPRAARKFLLDVELDISDNTRMLEISPDGTSVVFQSRRGLEVRDLAALEPRLLVAGASLESGASGITPFWSRDGRSIGYAAAGSLWRVPASGGSPTAVCKLPGEWNGGAWLGDDRIVFATTRGPMFRVSARGGDPEVFLPLEGAAELDFHQPSVLPDGTSIIYAVHRDVGVDTIEMLRDGKRAVVLRVDPGVINPNDNPQIVNVPYYADGHILYQRQQGNPGLWAVPFSIESGATAGDPFLVAPGMGYPSAASDGTLVAARLASASAGQLILIGRDGTVGRVLGSPMPELGMPRFSADGRRIAYVATEQQARDLFVWNLDTGERTRLTTTPGAKAAPVWIPGTQRMAFSAPGADCRAIFAMNADGTGKPELLAPKADAPAFSPDGRDLAYTTMCQQRRGLDRLVLASSNPIPLLDAPGGVDSPAISPDGRFIAFRNWASGTPELQVSRYPSMDGRWSVGATASPPVWSANGRELFFVSRATLHLMSVPVRLDPVFEAEASRALVDLTEIVGNELAFDVSPDGKSFAVVRMKSEGDDSRKILVVENWTELTAKQ